MRLVLNLWSFCLSFPGIVTTSIYHNIQHLKLEMCEVFPFLSLENSSLVGKYYHSAASKPLFHRRWVVPWKRENTSISLRGFCGAPNQRYRLINGLRNSLLQFYNPPLRFWIFSAFSLRWNMIPSQRQMMVSKVHISNLQQLHYSFHPNFYPLP